MSQLRQKFGSALLNSAMSASRHAPAPVKAAAVNAGPSYNHLTTNWLRRLQQTATTPDSREAHSQLQSLLDFYNVEKKVKENAPIDWQSFKDRIHTEGVVDKIHAKYDKFMASEYTVDSAVGRLGAASEKIKALDIALQYNYYLHQAHYLEHLATTETLANIGDVTQMSNLEFAKMNPHWEVFELTDTEVGNLAPDSYTEDQVFSRLCTQFNWGTRSTPAFTHSQDTVSCVSATLGKMGQ